MRKTGVYLFIFFLLVIFTFFPTDIFGNNQHVLATIDGKAITEKDFQHYLKLFNHESRFEPKTPAAKKKLLGHLIDRTILLQYANEHGYLELQELRKHQGLSQQEKETIILRQLLFDKIAHQVHYSPEEISAYQKKHQQLNLQQVREQLISQKQQKLFSTFMEQLRKKHKIVIY